MAKGWLSADERAELTDTAELIQGGFKSFDEESFLEGHMTPVIFGSALRHYGVNQLLEAIGGFAPPPKVVKATKAGVDTVVNPTEKEVTGFVFKVQANMDPNHRDRIAMLKLTSGKFQRGMKLKVQNTGKQLSVNAPIMFFASDRELAEDALAFPITAFYASVTVCPKAARCALPACRTLRRKFCSACA